MSEPAAPKLGFGMMRLPIAGGEDRFTGEIDVPQVCEMVDAYLDAGYDYFDTAYMYHRGKSETVAKEALSRRHPRHSYQFATKLPPWMAKSVSDCDRIFAEQLERTGAEYFDAYLLHSVEEGVRVETVESLRLVEWGARLRREGRIRSFGFSFHGTPELLESFLEKHRGAFDFAQIQLNYADWRSPLAQSEKLYAALIRHRLPIYVMEPVKGGMLAGTTSELEARMRGLRPNDSIAAWALRFAATLPGVHTVLSGMSNLAQLRDNLRTFRSLEPLSDAERALLSEVVAAMASKGAAPCTRCGYCEGDCPKKIRIPDVIKALNALRLYGDDMRTRLFYGNLGGGRAKDCIRCGQCEKSCPQHLPVTDLMSEASAGLDRV